MENITIEGKRLLDFYNCCVSSEQIPSEWNKVVIHPIQKKVHPIESKNVRHISLLPCPKKILEQLIKNQLEWLIESQGLLPNIQFEFRRGRGAIGIFNLERIQ